MENEVELTLASQGRGDQPIGDRPVTSVGEIGWPQRGEMFAREHATEALGGNEAKLKASRFGFVVLDFVYPQGPRWPGSSPPAVGTRQRAPP